MRIATSRHFADSLPAIAHEWSFHDQVHAHKTLDALDDIAALTRPDPPRSRTP